MVKIQTRATSTAAAVVTLTLPFERRCVTRQKVVLDGGEEAGLFLPRGDVLRHGDLLVTDDARVVRVVAAAEPVMVVRCADPRELARVAYHLGNRHVAVEVGEGVLKLEQDHVLRAMIEGLGASVEDALLPFEPEAGAYSGHTHSPGSVAARIAGPAPHRHGH
jgi:urease accessory protein